MAQNFICDSCNTHAEPDGSYNLYPKGWYSVSRRDSLISSRHACSPHCLINLAKVDILHSEPASVAEEVPDGPLPVL